MSGVGALCLASNNYHSTIQAYISSAIPPHKLHDQVRLVIITLTQMVHALHKFAQSIMFLFLFHYRVLWKM